MAGRTRARTTTWGATYPTRFIRGTTEVWLYPGQETVMDGMRIALACAWHSMDESSLSDKCVDEYDFSWTAVPE